MIAFSGEVSSFLWFHKFNTTKSVFPQFSGQESLQNQTYFRMSFTYNVFKFGGFCSVFYHIWTRYGDLQSKYPYSVPIRQNTDRRSSE